MQRILVIGSGGAGKTTVARQIAARLGLPLIHLDAHYWRPGWTETPPDEWRTVVQELIARPRWVMDGNYGGTMDRRIAASDTVILLDLPRIVCLWRPKLLAKLRAIKDIRVVVLSSQRAVDTFIAGLGRADPSLRSG